MLQFPHHVSGVMSLKSEPEAERKVYSPQEISQLGSSIDLGLPGVLSLSHHRCSHDLVSVLSGDQVGSLQENSSAVSEGHLLPCRLSSQGSVDCGGDIRSGGVGVGCNFGLVGGRIGLRLLGVCTDLDRSTYQCMLSPEAYCKLLTCLPPTTAGTSTGPFCFMDLIAAASPLRSCEPLP